MKPYGLVLAGGGMRGAYQIGAWKALLELKIPISTIVGTSIGAINGAVFVQGDYDKAYKIWESMSLEKVVKTKLPLNDDKNLFDRKNMYTIVKELVSNSGLDTAPLRELLGSVLDEGKIKKSNIDFGLVTFSISDFSPIEIFKNDIPSGKLIDYILASACFPGFKNTEIDRKAFIDGGVSNNMPVSMLVGNGIKDIIAIDVGGFGLTKSYDDEAVNLIRISPSTSLGSMFLFNEENTSRNINFGYFDALKAFGHVNGYFFFFTPREFDKLRLEFSKNIIKGLEHAALFYGMRRDMLYTADSFMTELFSLHSEKYAKYFKIWKRASKKSIINDITNNKLELDAAIKIPLLCDVLEERWLGNGTNNILRKFFSTEYSAATAMLVMMRRY